MSVQSVSAQCCWCSLHWVCCHQLPGRTPHNQLVLMRGADQETRTLLIPVLLTITAVGGLATEGRRRRRTSSEQCTALTCNTGCWGSHTVLWSITPTISTNTNTTCNIYSTRICTWFPWSCLCEYYTSHVWIWAVNIVWPDHLTRYYWRCKDWIILRKEFISIKTTVNLGGRSKGDCEAESEWNISISISWSEKRQLHDGFHCRTSYSVRSITDMIRYFPLWLTVAIEHTVSIHCKVVNISVQSTGDSSGTSRNTLVVGQATNPQQSNMVLVHSSDW